MIQAIIKKGKVLGKEVPAPIVSSGSVLIKVVNSCISAGTEMSGVVNSGKPLIKRAMEQPAQVAKVINMAKSIGIAKTLAKVRGTLEAGSATGYSLSGVVIATGKGVESFRIGDRVAAAGAGVANHAEYVDVPQNLVMKIPQNVEFKEASTVTLGGIAMQGVRRANLNFGEFCVVTGAGILGLLAMQMLKISGIRVAVIDLDENRLDIAKVLGAELVINPNKEDAVKIIESWTGGYGADCILFAAATSSSAPLSQSFQMAKKKGKVVLLGVVGMNINRADMYKKELDFLISTSYGPGRYDRNYEDKGCDYPYAYVRWTENRNMNEYLRLLSLGKINLEQIINGVYPISKVTQAFESLQVHEKPLAVLLDYGEVELGKINEYVSECKKITINNFTTKSGVINFALIGSSGFGASMHLPNMEKLPNKYKLHAVMSRDGHSAKSVAKQFGAKYATTDYEDILNDKSIDLVLIATRHDSHASFVLKALIAGKHVFVEKPLATNQDELNSIINFYGNNVGPKPVLFTAFNRRFSKYLNEIRKHTNKRINPLFIQYRMNAGFISPDHWVHENGGRIIGEGCHIIDLMTSLINQRVVSISSESLTPINEKFLNSDNKSIILKYEDGSIANIQYFTTGSKKHSKEYMEVHFDNKTIVMDDYKSLKSYGVKINEISTNVSQKGHFEELQVLHDTLSGKNDKWAIELWDMIQTTEITFSV